MTEHYHASHTLVEQDARSPSAVPLNMPATHEDYAGHWTFTVISAALAIIAMAIPMLAVHILVLWGLGRPTIFQQVRLGKGQQRFVMYKFRTMTDARDASGQPLPDDQRVMPLGEFLRRFRLDELPGLYNILRGDMSLVGPRPLQPADVAGVGWLAAERCRVKPGLTGWAQVNGNVLLSTEEKFALDLWYVGHRSLWMDLKILVKTSVVLIRGERRNQEAIRSAVRYADRVGRCRHLDASCA